MISKKNIEKLVSDYLNDGEYFLVDINVNHKNIIDVIVDGDNGIPISECVNISRQVESMYDRDEEDYELRVTSPGIDKPFKLHRQYKKYFGKRIEILTKEENTEVGLLKALEENSVTLEKFVGKKKKEKESLIIPFEEILEAKAVISFKK